MRVSLGTGVRTPGLRPDGKGLWDAGDRRAPLAQTLPGHSLGADECVCLPTPPSLLGSIRLPEAPDLNDVNASPLWSDSSNRRTNVTDALQSE